MELWAVTMVKNELDIIEHTLRHLASEGVTAIIIADNMSTDGTWDLIRTLTLDCPLYCVQDPEVGYYQARKMTDLVRQAFSGGADWVIPFDADELWYSTTGTLRDAVRAAQVSHDAQLAYAKLYNYCSTSQDDQRETNPFLRINNRIPRASDLPKVAVRRGSVQMAQGNHDAVGPAPFVRATSTIEIAHFPWRSWEQFRRKVEDGAAAYKATDLPEDVGKHWRDYGRLLEAGEDVLRGAWDLWFDPDWDLEYAPAPFLRHHDYQ